MMKKKIYDAPKVEYCGTRVAICPICNKQFITAPYHAYHTPGKKWQRVCSWACMRESERQAAKKK